MKLMGQLHMATSNVSLQQQMRMAAAHTQMMLQAAQYSQIQTWTRCDVLLWDEDLVWVGLFYGQFGSTSDCICRAATVEIMCAEKPLWVCICTSCAERGALVGQAVAEHSFGNELGLSATALAALSTTSAQGAISPLKIVFAKWKAAVMLKLTCSCRPWQLHER